MVPDEEWIHAGRLRAFLLGDCHLNQPLDLAVCRIHPAESSRDWGYLRAARIRLRPATSGEPVWVTAFTGWGLLPLTRSGHITGRQNYQRHDGCRCDFATDITAVEGMSGSPVISSDGEVLGILTLAGNAKFRGLSFGVSFEEAKSFLAAEGVIALGGVVDQENLSRLAGVSGAGARRRNPEQSEGSRGYGAVEVDRRARRDSNLSRLAGVSEAGVEERGPAGSDVGGSVLRDLWIRSRSSWSESRVAVTRGRLPSSRRRQLTTPAPYPRSVHFPFFQSAIIIANHRNPV